MTSLRLSENDRWLLINALSSYEEFLKGGPIPDPHNARRIAEINDALQELDTIVIGDGV